SHGSAHHWPSNLHLAVAWGVRPWRRPGRYLARLAQQTAPDHITTGVNMEVILRQAVEKLGQPGDVVKVSPGFARNYLLPRGIAYAATPGNLKRIAQEKARLDAAEDERRGSAQGVAGRLETVSLTFSARVGEE